MCNRLHNIPPFKINLEDLDWLVRLIMRYEIEKLGDIVGFIYEDLIPAEERHRLGQFYTPRPLASS
jgi:hypothetical protein